MFACEILAASLRTGALGRQLTSKTQTTGPPARFQDCKRKLGPWPPQIPAGSQGFSDGQHANISQFLLSFTDTGINCIKKEWVDFLLKDQAIPSFTSFQHGTVTGRQKALFKYGVQNPDDTPIAEVGGTYTKAGLDSITMIDSNQNTYIWGQIEPLPGVPRKSFLSPPNRGYVVGLFGASTKKALTQVGVCMSR